MGTNFQLRAGGRNPPQEQKPWVGPQAPPVSPWLIAPRAALNLLWSWAASPAPSLLARPAAQGGGSGQSGPSTPKETPQTSGTTRVVRWKCSGTEKVPPAAQARQPVTPPGARALLQPPGTNGHVPGSLAPKNSSGGGPRAGEPLSPWTCHLALLGKARSQPATGEAFY